jgi:ATP-dependent exoDNAse (exonuclease V) beta subunit
MIIYKELESYSFENMRMYKTPSGESLPSITTILGKTMSEEKQKSLANWYDSMGQAKAKAYTQKAANKGSNVHLLAERFLRGDDLQLNKFPPADVNVFNAIKIKLRGITTKALEIPLFSETLGVAGRCDCIGEYKGELSIIDFKTSNRDKSDAQIYDYKLQITFYALACNEMFDTNISQGVILMSSGDGFPLEWVFNINDYIAPLQEKIDLFYSKFL